MVSSLAQTGGAVDFQVLSFEPNKALSYTSAAYGLKSVVTWTLTSSSAGTHTRMEPTGFRPDQEQAYQGANYGLAEVHRQPGMDCRRVAITQPWSSLVQIVVFL
ncbi:SRPBCC domain-containing protein [Telmatocola sphagniphila]|uniref:SRPBCC domain-containing protein n=1 Tax=Telmatocola sphagniphila TaxID=1123043 RepID=A0A8E6BBP9_9BACT|nr:SRPBCC domain-containing protein [Telmatocola sphagniphila]